MAYYLRTKVKYPISQKAKNSIIADIINASIEEEEDGIFIYSRGSLIYYYLIDLSKEYQERILAEHTSSVDYYATRYVVQYENGVSKTVGSNID